MLLPCYFAPAELRITMQPVSMRNSASEKYLKARLEEAGVSAGKTHDLAKLLTLVVPLEPSWNVLRQDLIVLTDFAVDYRYPGSSATKADAKDAMRRCMTVRLMIRRSFGLKV